MLTPYGTQQAKTYGVRFKVNPIFKSRTIQVWFLLGMIQQDNDNNQSYTYAWLEWLKVFLDCGEEGEGYPSAYTSSATASEQRNSVRGKAKLIGPGAQLGPNLNQSSPSKNTIVI